MGFNLPPYVYPDALLDRDDDSPAELARKHIERIKIRVRIAAKRHAIRYDHFRQQRGRRPSPE